MAASVVLVGGGATVLSYSVVPVPFWGGRVELVPPRGGGATLVQRFVAGSAFPPFIVGDSVQGRIGRNKLTAPLLVLDSGTLGLLNTNVLDS